MCEEVVLTLRQSYFKHRWWKIKPMLNGQSKKQGKMDCLSPLSIILVIISTDCICLQIFWKYWWDNFRKKWDILRKIGTFSVNESELEVN